MNLRRKRLQSTKTLLERRSIDQMLHDARNANRKGVICFFYSLISIGFLLETAALVFGKMPIFVAMPIVVVVPICVSIWAASKAIGYGLQARKLARSY